MFIKLLAFLPSSLARSTPGPRLIASNQSVPLYLPTKGRDGERGTTVPCKYSQSVNIADGVLVTNGDQFQLCWSPRQLASQAVWPLMDRFTLSPWLPCLNQHHEATKCAVYTPPPAGPRLLHLRGTKDILKIQQPIKRQLLLAFVCHWTWFGWWHLGRGTQGSSGVESTIKQTPSSPC